ncbi:MAG: LysE family transporter, partial [Klebsiella michiganensis]|nr:LysE family transporter [Klebsiella michiganensis]
APSASNWFLKGMLGNVLNPKMGIFYVSFLPQFIPAGHSPTIWTFLLVAIHVVIGTLWSLTLILASRYAAGLLKTPTFIRWMDRATGGVFMLFAAKLALSHR